MGKTLRICSGKRGIRKWWAGAPGAPGKGPNKFLKIFEEKNFFGNTYLVSRCRGGVWYILLRNVKMEQQRHVVSSAP